MQKATRDMLESPDFKRLVRRKWVVSTILTLCLFVLYYGFILLIAYNKPFMGRKIGEFTTLGIPMGVGVIILAWILTTIYVAWANSSHDAEADRLRDKMKN
jgi:uncharacterized membrane protein (DUF485 family)